MNKNNIWVILIIMAAATGCAKLDYKKTKDGLLYKIISTPDSKGPVVKVGNVLKLYYVQKLNDSVLQSNFGKQPVYQPIDNNQAANDYSPTEVFPMLHKGDSAVTVMLIDSLILKGKMQNLPPFMKRGDRITVTFKVVDLFATDSLARADNSRTMAALQEKQKQEMAGEGIKEDKEISDYLATNKIAAQKTPRGAYVQVLSPGAGLQADSGKKVSLKYKGTTLSGGKVFDTNMDSSFHHTEPLEFLVGDGSMVPGFDDGVRYLKNGGKAKVFVPAVLGFGPNPVMQGGKPYENLVFEIQVIDVKEKPAMVKPGSIKNDSIPRKK